MTNKRSIADVYTGNDLGVVYSKTSSSFRLWAPLATLVKVRLFADGDKDEPYVSYDMTEGEGGSFIYTCEGDFNGKYYDYAVTIDDKTIYTVDPYAKAVGVNGNRGMIIDLHKTDPEGFRETKRPQLESPTDAIIYELHVRDFTIDEGSGVIHKGKYLGLTELNTRNTDGIFTGLSHIKELGVTHVQLMPIFDFATIDEADDRGQFNWGYDPKNYNAPEGSYSSNAHDGATRISELKKVIQTLHENGLRVVMDVVYNHMFQVEGSVLQNTTPDYYFRKNGESYSDASGCGNETASERYMMRKYIIDSVIYWATEYCVDGFRFDLMGIHDIGTMIELRSKLEELNQQIIVYGEGWTCSTSVYPASDRLLKENIFKCPGVGVFSDSMRDAIKGSVFNARDGGYIAGHYHRKGDIMHGIVAETCYYGNNYPYAGDKWAKEPNQAIHYVSCHDNHTLWDKLQVANPRQKEANLKKMNKIAAAMVMLSQGIPFLLSGEEIMRSKKTEEGTFSENSYNLSDYVNAVKWNDKKDTMNIFRYYQGLIQLRKAHPLFRLKTCDEITKKLRFAKTNKRMIAYYLQDEQEKLLVIFNASSMKSKFTVDGGVWSVLVNEETAGNKPMDQVTGRIRIPARSVLVLKLI